MLGFHAWPQAPQVAAQRLVVADAPQRVTRQDRVFAARLLGGPSVVGGLRLVPGGLPGAAAVTGSGLQSPRATGGPQSGGLPAPGVAGGVQGPSAGTVSKTDPDGDGFPGVSFLGGGGCDCSATHSVGGTPAWALLAHRASAEFGLRLPGLDIAPEHGEAQKRRCLEALALWR